MWVAARGAPLEAGLSGTLSASDLRVRFALIVTSFVVAGCGAPSSRPEVRAPVAVEAASSAGPQVADLAAVWDAPERDTWQRPVEAIALLGAERGQTVVDLGTGTGYFLPFLSIAVGPRGHVLALDTQPAMIDHVRARAALEGMANVEARVVDPTDPGLEPASVDHILVVDTWGELPDRAAYAVRLRDALRPGGTVVVIDFTPEGRRGPPSVDRLAPETVALELANAGLEVEIVEEALLDQYAVRGTVSP